MSFRQVPRGSEGRTPHVHWCYQPTEEKEKWFAHVAGPCVWYWCHEPGKTKPCVSELTGHEVGCQFCECGLVPIVRGFQPLYREDIGKPVFVILPEMSRELIDALEFHRRVLVERKEGIGEPVSIIHAPNPQPRFQTKVAWKMEAPDLTRSLVKIWNLPELTAWYHETQRHLPPIDTTAPAPKPRPVLKSDGQPFSPMTRAAAERYSGNMEADYDKVVNRLAKNASKLPPSENGNHKPR